MWMKAVRQTMPKHEDFHSVTWIQGEGESYPTSRYPRISNFSSFLALNETELSFAFSHTTHIQRSSFLAVNQKETFLELSRIYHLLTGTPMGFCHVVVRIALSAISSSCMKSDEKNSPTLLACRIEMWCSWNILELRRKSRVTCPRSLWKFETHSQNHHLCIETNQTGSSTPNGPAKHINNESTTL